MGLFRRIGGGRRAGGGLGGGGLLFHDPHGGNRPFVEQEQRNRQRGLAQHVRRRQDGGDNKGNHDEIAPLFAQHFGGDDADPAQQRQDDGKLEGDAEGKDQRHHQRQIFADLGQQLD